MAVLVGCRVPTGWGSAVNTANVAPGDMVAVYGVGGIGINAVQGARVPLQNASATADLQRGGA